MYAYQAIGTPYVWATAGDGAFDCSGLVMMSWRQAGVHLAHSVRDQWAQTWHIERAALIPGDLVFYEDLGHVALYIGHNQVIHAPHTGSYVQVASVDMMPIVGFGRP